MIDIWQEIYSSIRRNKLRTFLTGFAVAWGIFMLIVLLGAGNGLINAFEKSSSEQALNSIKIYPGITSQAYDGLEQGRRIDLKENDLKTSETLFSNNIIEAQGTISVNDINISYDNAYVNTRIYGVFPEFVNVEAIKKYKGRFINKIDINEQRKVIVLHKNTAEILFNNKNVNPIGQFVKAQNVVYKVVGLYNDKGDSGNKPAYIPFTTLQLIYQKGGDVENIIMTTKNLNTIESNKAFEEKYRMAIGKVHRFSPTDRTALWIWNRLRGYMQQQTANDVLNIAIWIIGIFTLLSGVVGVSNIMLITVKERTREFGIRKALGAKPNSILALIIAESIGITTLFGYIGMVAGIATTEWMNHAFGQQVMDAGMFSQVVFLNPTVDIRIAIQATLTLIIAGTFAGIVPAKKAANIRPIEALRAE